MSTTGIVLDRRKPMHKEELQKIIEVTNHSTKIICACISFPHVSGVITNSFDLFSSIYPGSDSTAISISVGRSDHV